MKMRMCGIDRASENFCEARRRFVLTAVAAGCALPARAQDGFPQKAVRIVVPYSAGTATDAVVRLYAGQLSQQWGHQVYVENLPGLNGVIGTRSWVRGPKDPHSLIAIASTSFANVGLYDDLQFDAIKDFSPIVNLCSSSLALVVPSNSPYKSLDELVSAAKMRPHALNYGSSGVGTPAHLLMAITEKQRGFSMTHIPYKTAAAGLIGVMAGEVDAYYIVIAAANPQIEAGKLRALATTGPKRHPLLPKIPTLSESGLPGFDLVGWFGLMGSVGMDNKISEYISSSVGKINNSGAIKNNLSTLGVDLSFEGPAQFKRTFIADSEKWLEMVRVAEIKSRK